MNDYPIGVFDSGLGGLTAVKALKEILPNEDIVYFGDTGRVPYGTKSIATVKRYAREDVNFLTNHGCKMIIAACGTVSSVAQDVLDSIDVDAIGVVRPAAQAATKVSRNKKIGVIGTGTTIASGSFEREIKSIDSECEVYSTACPVFVTLVENGWNGSDDEIAYLSAQRYLEDIKNAGVDTLILGCTHFPLLSEVIHRVMGKSVTLIDTGLEAAKAAKTILSEKNLLNDSESIGKCEFNVSDDIDKFSYLAKTFLGTEVKSSVNLVRL